MKKTMPLISAMMFAVFILSVSKAHSQAPASKVILENDRVKLINIEFKPGDFAPSHSHPDNIVYILSSGKMEITDQGKAAQVFDFKEGQAIWMPAVTHTAKNIGPTPVHMVVVELKEAPKK